MFEGLVRVDGFWVGCVVLCFYVFMFWSLCLVWGWLFRVGFWIGWLVLLFSGLVFSYYEVVVFVWVVIVGVVVFVCLCLRLKLSFRG